MPSFLRAVSPARLTVIAALALGLVAPAVASAEPARPLPDAADVHCRATVVRPYSVTGVVVHGVGCRTAHRVVARWLRAGTPTTQIGPWSCELVRYRPYVVDGCTAADGRTIGFEYGSLFG